MRLERREGRVKREIVSSGGLVVEVGGERGASELAVNMGRF